MNETIKRILLVVILFIIGSILMFFLMCYLSFYGIPFYHPYYTENGILLHQEVGYLKNNCDNCLILIVQFYECQEPHLPQTCGYRNQTYFFANENKLLNINNGENITITWKWVNSEIGYRIRGVK